MAGTALALCAPQRATGAPLPRRWPMALSVRAKFPLNSPCTRIPRLARGCFPSPSGAPRGWRFTQRLSAAHDDCEGAYLRAERRGFAPVTKPRLLAAERAGGGRLAQGFTRGLSSVSAARRGARRSACSGGLIPFDTTPPSGQHVRRIVLRHAVDDASAFRPSTKASSTCRRLRGG